MKAEELGDNSSPNRSQVAARSTDRGQPARELPSPLKLLLYVSKQSLSGDVDGLNERSIGETVFERSPDYDTRDDNIVRSHASRLRLRLQEYFEREGAEEDLRVSIPGELRPQFEPFVSEPPAARVVAPSSEFTFSTMIPGRLLRPQACRRGTSTFLVVCLVLLAAAVAAVFTSIYLRFPGAMEQTASHKLWSQMFRRDRSIHCSGRQQPGDHEAPDRA